MTSGIRFLKSHHADSTLRRALLFPLLAVLAILAKRDQKGSQLVFQEQASKQGTAVL